jgi:hypothetical protein
MEVSQELGEVVMESLLEESPLKDLALVLVPEVVVVLVLEWEAPVEEGVVLLCSDYYLK